MKGSVEQINPQKSMVAVRTEDDDFSIIELLRDEVEIGDELEWSGHYPLGGHTINNLIQRRKMSVFVQNHCLHQSPLRQQLLI